MAKTQKGSLVPTKSRLGRCEALKIVILSTCVNDKLALGWKRGRGGAGADLRRDRIQCSFSSGGRPNEVPAECSNATARSRCEVIRQRTALMGWRQKNSLGVLLASQHAAAMPT